MKKIEVLLSIIAVALMSTVNVSAQSVKKVSELSLAEKEAYLAGSTELYSTVEYNSKLQKTKFFEVSLSGGIALYEGYCSPTGRLEAEYHHKRWILGVEGAYLQGKHIQTYKRYAVWAKAGFKILNFRKFHLAVAAGTGYGYQQSDVPESTVNSANSGWAHTAGLKATWYMGKHFGLTAKAGADFMPLVLVGHENQRIQTNAYASVGFSYRF